MKFSMMGIQGKIHQHLTISPGLATIEENFTREECLEIALYDNCDLETLHSYWDHNYEIPYDVWRVKCTSLYPMMERLFVTRPSTNSEYDGLILAALMEGKDELLQLMVKHGVLMSDRLTTNVKPMMRV